MNTDPDAPEELSAVRPMIPNPTNEMAALGKGPPIQLPNRMVNAYFGEVNVKPIGSILKVTFTVKVDITEKIWQTGVALDGSTSMARAYGRALEGKVPDEVMDDYETRGLVAVNTVDGRRVRNLRSEALKDAMGRGFLKYTTNTIQEHARGFISLLAEQLDADSGTSVIYWACGDGAQLEPLGDFTAEQCKTLEFRGPQKEKLGKGTQLMPALRYFVDRYPNAEKSLFLFLTDGRIDDMEEVKKYSIDLARQIHEKKHKPVKCVLIGVGDQIDETQMYELDELNTGVSFDVWDHKIAATMRDLKDIFAEVIEENRIVARYARIVDSFGVVVREFPKGLTAKATFMMQNGSHWFDLSLGEGTKPIRQSVTITNPKLASGNRIDDEMTASE